MKIILGITGEIASGKGTVAKHLEEKYQGKSYRFSTALRDVAKRMCLEESRENLQKISTLFREKFDSNILSKVVRNDVENDQGEVVLIDGVRRVADMEYLKNLPGFKLLYVDTDLENRYHRITKRRENSDDEKKTYEEFLEDNKREAETQVKDLKNYADFVINNNGTFLELYHEVDKLMAGLRNKL